MEVDTSRTVAKVGVKMSSNSTGEKEIQGLRLVDQAEEYIVDETWRTEEGKDTAEWVYEDVPSGHEIVGFQCSAKVIPDGFPRIGFALWKPDLTMPGWLNEDELETFQEQSVLLIEKEEVSKKIVASSPLAVESSECKECGFPNEAGAKNCEMCGEDL